MKKNLPTLLALVVLAYGGASLGCGGDGGGPDASDAIDVTDAVDAVDAAADGDATPLPGVPILERPPAISHACTEALAPMTPTDSEWNASGLVTDGAEAWALRTGATIGISTIGLDGVVGAPLEIPGQPYTMQSATLAAGGGDFALIWVEAAPGSGQLLRFALARDGAIRVAPTTLAGTTATSVGTPDAVGLAEGGTALSWMDSTSAGTTRLRFARVDDAGGFVVGPVDLDLWPQAYGASGVALASAGTGYAVAWTRTVATGEGEVWFARVDADGAAVVSPRRVSRQAGGGWQSRVAGWRTGSVPLVADADRAWLAYSVSYFNGDYMNSEGWTTVELAVIDGAGNVASHALQAPVNGVTATDPTLFRLDGTLGLLWSQGAAIYVCAGCYVDNDLKVVLLDPDALVPVSAVATHKHADHGYVTPSAVVLGADVLSLSSQDFHALSLPTVAVMACTATP